MDLPVYFSNKFRKYTYGAIIPARSSGFYLMAGEFFTQSHSSTKMLVELDIYVNFLLLLFHFDQNCNTLIYIQIFVKLQRNFFKYQFGLYRFVSCVQTNGRRCFNSCSAGSRLHLKIISSALPGPRLDNFKYK
jgi:hypothetical protein